jgi:hypothetical protein
MPAVSCSQLITGHRRASPLHSRFPSGAESLPIFSGLFDGSVATILIMEKEKVRLLYDCG